MKSKREIGESLELLVLSYLQELGDKQARLSRASGASNDISDITCSDFYIECKVRDKDNVIMEKKVWQHLTSQIPINSKKTPVYVYRNKDKDNFVVLKLEDLIMLLKK